MRSLLPITPKTVILRYLKYLFHRVTVISGKQKIKHEKIHTRAIISSFPAPGNGKHKYKIYSREMTGIRDLITFQESPSESTKKETRGF